MHPNSTFLHRLKGLGLVLFPPLALALVLLSIPLSPPVQAQVGNDYGLFKRLLESETVGKAVATDDTDVAILIRYTGTTGGGTVAVASNGDITLSTGAVGASAVDTTLECPVSGALGGIIDVSDTACDTMGEVVDIINGSANWRAVILDGLRADSSNDTLNALSEAAANGVNGLGLVWDTSVAFKYTLALTPDRNMGAYIDNNQGQFNRLTSDPYRNTRTVLTLFRGLSTYGSGTSTFQVIDVASNLNTKASALAPTGSETTTTLYSIAAGASTVDLSLDASKWGPYGIQGQKGHKLVARINNSAAMSAVDVAALGYRFRYQ